MSVTRDKLLDEARDLIQDRGYNAFSYRDLAERVGIRTASIHYHFPTKPDLARSLVLRHCEALQASLSAFDAETPTGLGRVRRFAGLFRTTLSRDFQMCLCGILAAEVRSLPAEVVTEVRRFFSLSEDWLEETLAFASDAGEILPIADTFSAARSIILTLEGAMLLARLTEETDRLEAAVESIFDRLRSGLVV